MATELFFFRVSMLKIRFYLKRIGLIWVLLKHSMLHFMSPFRLEAIKILTQIKALLLKLDFLSVVWSPIHVITFITFLFPIDNLALTIIILLFLVFCIFIFNILLVILLYDLVLVLCRVMALLVTL